MTVDITRGPAPPRAICSPKHAWQSARTSYANRDSFADYQCCARCGMRRIVKSGPSAVRVDESWVRG